MVCEDHLIPLPRRIKRAPRNCIAYRQQYSIALIRCSVEAALFLKKSVDTERLTSSDLVVILLAERSLTAMFEGCE
jgi:hypothetical protein